MPPTTPPLFVASDLTEPLGHVVSETKAAAAERVVWGWLKPILGGEARPDPVPDEVFSWAVELGAIYLENPSGLASYQLGAERLGFSAERRAQILIEAAGDTPGSASTPRGSFPEPSVYPPGFWR